MKSFFKIAAISIAACAVIVPAAHSEETEETEEKDYAVALKYLDGLEYRNIGPWRGGRVTTVSGTVSDDQTYYMGATGGGVWKTTNAGISWKNISDEFFKTGSVGAVAVSASDPNVIVVGMGESPFRGVASSHGDGVYISTDAGVTWHHSGLDDTRQISAVHIHAKNPDIIWVAAQGSPWAPTKDRGVYKSTDGGKSWEKTLFVDENTGAVDLSVDPNNPRILYAAMWDHDREPWFIRSGGEGSAIWKSTDSGETWEKVSKGLPEGTLGKIGVAASPAKSGLVWAVVEAKEKGGLYRSDDFGESWTFVNGDRRIHARSWYYMHVVADPQDSDTVFVMNAPFLKSTDGGKSFKNIRVPHGDVHDHWINPNNTDIMINGNDGGATVTMNGGKSWSTIYNQPTGQFYRVNADNTLFYRVYGGQQDNSTVGLLSRAPDGSIGSEDFFSVGGCESGYTAFNPDDPRLVYAGCYLGLITEFDTLNRTGRNIAHYPELAFGVAPKDRKYRFNWNAPIVVSKHDPSVIYHGGNVLLRSTDRGQNWTEISPDLTRDDEEQQGPMGGPITNEVSENYNTIMYVAESMHSADTIWVGSDDGLVHLTRNGGTNWQNVTPKGIGSAIINAIDVSPHDSGTVYIAVTRYKENDHTPLIYKTTNYGKKWRQIAKDIPEGAFVRVVREDTVRKGLLFAGTETGIYVSFDDGGQWQPFRQNMPHLPITDLKVHGNDLVVSTQGRGFWIMDDMTPLRELGEEQLESKLTLFTPNVAYRLERAGGRNNGGPTSPNPKSGARIHYILNDIPEEDAPKLTLEILDANGQVIRTIDSKDDDLPAEEGLNIFFWDLAGEKPESIPGLWSVAGAGSKIDGYTRGPGQYTARLSYGETSLSENFELKYDPRLDVADGKILEQQEYLERTYAMIDEFQRTIVGLRQIKNQAETIVGAAKKTGEAETLEEAAKAVYEAIKDFEAGHINTKREFFQDVLNWPDKLHSDLIVLGGNIDGSTSGLTAGVIKRFDDLSEKFTAAVKARDALVSGAVADFNKAYKEAGIGGLIIPPFVKTEENTSAEGKEEDTAEKTTENSDGEE